MEKDVFDKAYIESGGSVANTALAAARKLGCNPIIFVAQDLCLEGERSHAAGTMHESERYVPEGINYVTLPGNYQKEVKSFRNFFIFLRWTENYIRKYPQIEFINATAGGARIEGAQLATLEELFDRFSAVPDADIRGQILGLKKESPTGFGKDVVKKMKKALKELRQFDRLLEEGLDLTVLARKVINGEKKLSEREEKKCSAKMRSLFLKCCDREIMKLIDTQIKNELNSMLRSIETSRIRTKGFSEVMLAMPDFFRKLLVSSKTVQEGFEHALKAGQK